MGNNIINHDTTNPNSFVVIVSIVVTSILLLIICIGSFYLYRSQLSMSQNVLQDTANRHPYIVEIESEAQNNLERLYWIDKKSGIVHIPIEIAKSRVVEEYK